MKILTEKAIAELEDKAWSRGNTYATKLWDERLMNIEETIERVLSNKKVFNSRSKKEVILQAVEDAKREILNSLL